MVEKKVKKIKSSYDQGADVMYISFGEPHSSVSQEVWPGIYLRYDMSDVAFGEKGEEKTLTGITILDYHKKTQDRIRYFK